MILNSDQLLIWTKYVYGLSDYRSEYACCIPYLWYNFFSINSRVIEGIWSKSNFSSSEMIHFWQALHYKKKTQTNQQISSTALHIEHIILRKQQLSNIFIFKKSLWHANKNVSLAFFYLKEKWRMSGLVLHDWTWNWWSTSSVWRNRALVLDFSVSVRNLDATRRLKYNFQF